MREGDREAEGKSGNLLGGKGLICFGYGKFLAL